MATVSFIGGMSALLSVLDAFIDFDDQVPRKSIIDKFCELKKCASQNADDRQTISRLDALGR